MYVHAIFLSLFGCTRKKFTYRVYVIFPYFPGSVWVTKSCIVSYIYTRNSTNKLID